MFGGKVLILDPMVPAYYLEKSYLNPVGRLGEQSLPGVESRGKYCPNSRTGIRKALVRSGLSFVIIRRCR